MNEAAIWVGSWDTRRLQGGPESQRYQLSEGKDREAELLLFSFEFSSSIDKG
jgi:hypothetical protein